MTHHKSRPPHLVILTSDTVREREFAAATSGAA